MSTVCKYSARYDTMIPRHGFAGVISVVVIVDVLLPRLFLFCPNRKHEHVYTNGDICLSLLGKDWRPTMTAQSIAVSILSILSSAQSKSIPMDNAKHAQNKPGQYQQDWVYHDDSVRRLLRLCVGGVEYNVSWMRSLTLFDVSFFVVLTTLSW